MGCRYGTLLSNQVSDALLHNPMHEFEPSSPARSSHGSQLNSASQGRKRNVLSTPALGRSARPEGFQDTIHDLSLQAGDPLERQELMEALHALAKGTTLGVVALKSVSLNNADKESACLLGQGRFSTVVETRVDLDGELTVVASKRFLTKALLNKCDTAPSMTVPLASLQAARREVDALCSIGLHACIVRLLGIVIPETSVCLDTESAPLQLLLERSSGALHALLANVVEWTELQRCGRLKLLGDVATGLAAIHNAGFAHLDVKSHNVLIDRAAEGGWRAKVCDLGSAHFVQTNIPLPPVRGIVGWAAPEIFEPASMGLRFDPRAADVFSVGMLIWAILAGPCKSNPLLGLMDDAYFDALAAGHRPPLPEDADALPEAEIAVACWQSSGVGGSS
jgi:serine/threonine protein kinase